jgi:hypothetical protein
MRSPNAWLTASSCALALALGGCGGGDETPPGPRLDPAVAVQLAGQSDQIADLIDDGNVCGAAGRADDLVRNVENAIDAGQVPPSLAQELRENAVALQNDVNCEPPPPPPAPPPPPPGGDEDDEDDDNGKDKKDKDRPPPPPPPEPPPPPAPPPPPPPEAEPPPPPEDG